MTHNKFHEDQITSRTGKFTLGELIDLVDEVRDQYDRTTVPEFKHIKNGLGSLRVQITVRRPVAVPEDADLKKGEPATHCDACGKPFLTPCTVCGKPVHGALTKHPHCHDVQPKTTFGNCAWCKTLVHSYECIATVDHPQGNVWHRSCYEAHGEATR